MKKKYDEAKAPSLSPAKMLSDNLFLIKTVFKAAPGSMALYCFEKFRANLIKLIDAARDSGTEVIYVRHDDGGETL